MAAGDRWLCGWRVRSEIALPDLLPWTGCDDHPADLILRLGAVPERLEAPVVEEPLLQIGRDGDCRFAIPGVAAYWVAGTGQEVTVDPVMAPSAPDIRVFLLGTVLGILCHRRGFLPLHASCIRLGGRAVAFAGPSGAGKSTLAAAFFKRGHTILADDVTVVEASAPGGPRVWPAFPRLKLWQDMANALDFATEGQERSRAELKKFHLPIVQGFAADPMPLAGLYHLSEARGGTVGRANTGLERLRGAQALAALDGAVYRAPLGRMLVTPATFFDRLSRVARVTPSFRLARLLTLPATEALAARLNSEYEATPYEVTPYQVTGRGGAAPGASE